MTRRIACALAALCALTACGIPREGRTVLAFGQGASLYLADTVDEEIAVITGLEADSVPEGQVVYPFNTKRNNAFTLRREERFEISERVGIEAALGIEAGRQTVHLPEGYDLYVPFFDSFIWFSDPITLKFQSLGVVPELMATYRQPLGAFDLTLGTGGGVAIQRVRLDARSALIIRSEEAITTTPFATAKGVIEHRDSGFGLEGRYYHVPDGENRSTVALRLAF